MPHHIETTPQRNIVGIILVILGCLFLFDAFDILDFGNLFSNWWPLIIVAIGLLKLRGQDKTGGTILLVVGLAFLSATLDIVDWGNIFRFWPVILILIGISMLVRAKEGIWWGSGVSGETSEDFFKANVIFGGVDRTVTSENFKGAEAKALFGGVKLDLRDAKTTEKECHLELTALFGGVEVILPREWKVSVSGTPILGAIEDATRPIEGAESAVQVICRCSAAFGAVEIKN
ncbi:MAG: hypothetical protein JSU61_04860 [Fidelibacterota bacterium]|nr:MAG: hypothetical protein JSU61_04860 [Candidatus Neomarinimicrobiota bacterium]